MKRTALICTALLLYCSSFAQNTDAGKDGKHKSKSKRPWLKPNDLAYYNMNVGYVSCTGQVYDIKAPAFWGQARTCLLNYVMDGPPKRKFHVRDIADIQLGVGWGSEFYANIMMNFGLKFKYDISPKADFGFYPSYQFALDAISYYTPMIHGFARYSNFLVEVGTGKNSEDLAQSKQRKVKHVNFKYFFKPGDPKTWSVNVSYWQINGKNNQVTNDWETLNQYMIGLGKQF